MTDLAPGPQEWTFTKLLTAIATAQGQTQIHAVIERYVRDHLVIMGPHLTSPRALAALAQLLSDSLHWAVRVRDLPPEQRVLWQAILSERCGPELRRPL